jgi:hypothetical protein
VTTSAFHYVNQPAVLREFHRVLASHGLLAVATLANEAGLGPSRWVVGLVGSLAVMRWCAGGPTPALSGGCEAGQARVLGPG